MSVEMGRKVEGLKVDLGEMYAVGYGCSHEGFEGW